MNRDELIEKVHDKYVRFLCREQVCEIIDLCQPQDTWVSVKDRLPDEGAWVIGATTLFNGNRVAKELFLDCADPVYWLADGDWEREVTHWMPLPSPPVQDET